MKIDDIKPAHCYARANRLLAEAAVIRDELGRTGDTRPVPEVTGAQPREVYFEAIVAWHKVDRLAAELGAQTSRSAPAAPVLRDLKPGHVLQMLDSVLERVDDIKRSLQLSDAVAEAAIEPARQPSDVLVTLIRVNRELSRMLERPFTPADVYRTVALASTYASRLGGGSATLAPFERKRKPANCYERLETCLAAATALIAKRGETALSSRGTLQDVAPSDVYDLANLVLGELAFLHSLTPNAAPVHAFEPKPHGHRLPSHVYQLARTLEAQLAAVT
jgi:hypothetical protein